MGDSEGTAKSGGKSAGEDGLTSCRLSPRPAELRLELGSHSGSLILSMARVTYSVTPSPRLLICAMGILPPPLSELSRGLAEILCVIHLARCLANNQLPVRR